MVVIKKKSLLSLFKETFDFYLLQFWEKNISFARLA
jgi:hypothetical protein